MGPENFLRQRIEVDVILECRKIVKLGEPLNGSRQKQYGASILAQNCARHFLFSFEQPEREPERLVDTSADFAEECHVLHFFCSKIRERIEGLALVDFVILGEIQNLRSDELFYIAEQVSISTHLNMSEARFFMLREERHAPGPRQTHGQPMTALVEMVVPQNISYSPVDLVRILQAIGMCICRDHDLLLFLLPHAQNGGCLLFPNTGNEAMLGAACFNDNLMCFECVF